MTVDPSGAVAGSVDCCAVCSVRVGDYDCLLFAVCHVGELGRVSVVSVVDGGCVRGYGRSGPGDRECVRIPGVTMTSLCGSLTADEVCRIVRGDRAWVRLKDSPCAALVV